MIAPVQHPAFRKARPAWHTKFLEMLPAIRRQASVAFCHLDREAREEMVQEVIANALVAFVRLIEHDKEDLAYPSVLARYAVAQLNDGRRVGNRLNTREVLAKVAQRRHGFVVERLDRYDDTQQTWQEAVVEDTRTATVPEIVGFRIDFPRWLARHTRRDRKIAQTLSLGHGTGETARRFGVSPARISQLRREFFDDWQAFHGEAESDGASLPVAKPNTPVPASRSTAGQLNPARSLLRLLLRL